MSDKTEAAGIRRRVDYSGHVSPGFTALLTKYGASPRVARAACEATGDPGRRVIATSNTPAGTPSGSATWTGIGSLLTRLAGADQDLMARLPRERPHFQTLGLTLISTALIAAFSMGVAIDLMTGSILLSIPVGALWGAIILVLDRSLVVSASERSRTMLGLLALLPRLMISVVIGTVTAVPLVLKIFEPEIQTHIMLTRPELSGRKIGLLDRLEVLNQLSAQSPSLQLAVWLVNLLLIIIEVMPSLMILLTRLRPANAYEVIIEVKERYIAADQEVGEIRKRAPSHEMIDDSADVQQRIDALNDRIDHLVESLERDRERELADVIDLSMRRRRAS